MYILKRFLTILAAITLIFSFTACQKEEKAESNTINGREWLLKQDSVNEQYIKVMESTEDVYSLYISGKMSSEDFYTELQILQGQLFTIQDAYQKEKDKIVIDPESLDVSFEGIDHFENLFTETNNLYVASINPQGSPYSVVEISYVYMNYKEKLLDEYTRYQAAIYTLDYYNDDGTTKKITTTVNSESEVTTGISTSRPQ